LSDKRKEPKLIFEPLGQKHGRAAFSCGVEALDAYLQKQASHDVRKHAAAPFVLAPDGKIVAGYYTLSQYAIDLGDLPEEVVKKLSIFPAGSATLLGRLAVGSGFRGKGLGEKLLMDALYRSLKLSRQAASTGVVADAKDEAARAFYRKYGFIQLPKINQRLFLPMGTIKKLFAGK
jgi:predicted GNAT family N-acyltransferase